MSPSNGLTAIYYDPRVGYAQDIQLMSSDLNGHVGADGKCFFFCFSLLIVNTIVHSSLPLSAGRSPDQALRLVPSVQGAGRSPELNDVKL